jgi:hypothetical protein
MFQKEQGRHTCQSVFMSAVLLPAQAACPVYQHDPKSFLRTPPKSNGSHHAAASKLHLLAYTQRAHGCWNCVNDYVNPHYGWLTCDQVTRGEIVSASSKKPQDRYGLHFVEVWPSDVCGSGSHAEHARTGLN